MPETADPQLFVAMEDDKKAQRRRKHKNSKNGCPNCKKRRVKCLEDLPACLNCVKHKAKCGYLDYSEAQLAELRRAKDADDLEKKAISPIAALLLGLKRKPRLPVTLPNLGLKTAQLLNLPFSYQELQITAGNSTLTRPDLLRNIRENTSLALAEDALDDRINVPAFSRDGVSDVLNFQHNVITQDFDNLLAKGHDLQIIYPVYLINQGSLHGTPAVDADPAFSLSRDVFNASFAPGGFIDTLAVPSHEPWAAYAPGNGHRSLPGAVAGASFGIVHKQTVDYRLRLLLFLKGLGPHILKGSASLLEIRHLYTLWLNLFIYKAYLLDVMCSCLLNLTTNYLISNSMGTMAHLPFGPMVDRTRVKNRLLVTSIKHYAHVIKGLKDLLNAEDDAELCLLVSYILSLMSIYDPEATLNSTVCFRDGLFSILLHNLNLLARINQLAPLLIPVHLQLMINIERLVYLQGYNPQFLSETSSMLVSYGNILKMINLQLENHANNSVENNPTLVFVEHKFNELLGFVNDSINNYIPTINDNLLNIDVQQQVTYTMTHRWVRLQPLRFVSITLQSDPLEMVLYLFYKVVKKAMFAIVPQVRYFFLRDFDSPLMLDVFALHNDFSIYEHELDRPANMCIPADVYESTKTQLKILSSYLIRILTFLEARLRRLYRTIVYEENTKRQFPITNVREWRNSITDISQTRHEFHQKIGLIEVPITSFLNTTIRAHHYPALREDEAMETPTPDNMDEGQDVVNLLTLTSSGLLENDCQPPL